jgi:hypothetical protein
MATGIINSNNLVFWQNGTVVTPSFLQAVQDNINSPGNITFSGIKIDGTGASGVTPEASHLVIAGTIPTVTAGAGAGTTPTVGIGVDSSDSRGRITLLTGTTPSASSIILTVNFITAYATKRPTAIITPSSATTAALSGTSTPFVAVQGGPGPYSGFSITSNSVALVASTNYEWNYIVIG